jgi:hypothetical protein
VISNMMLLALLAHLGGSISRLARFFMCLSRLSFWHGIAARAWRAGVQAEPLACNMPARMETTLAVPVVHAGR